MQITFFHYVRLATVCFVAVVSARAADWPMWRGDVQRSGTSNANLPDDLKLQWTLALPPTRLAWPNEPRLHFDASYEPIVSGQRMIVGSPNDGSVTAFDTRTGTELWKIFADGPVRLAPVAWDDKVYFGSDDGYLRCVSQSDGSLLWKVRGAPDDRPDHRHLGNGRLISYWPVRGGPVLADGVVYFGAGVWPTMGVFVRAVDASSGEVLWTNANSHAIENVRIDHNYLHESGISPQGHMLIAGDLLIVPNGRSMPARLDRKNGELKYFVQGYRNGDSRVIVGGDVALVGTGGVISLKDGREIASRWAAAGKDAPPGWSNKRDLFEGPMFAYKFQPGCDFRSVIADGACYGMRDRVLYAYDLSRSKTSLYDLETQGLAFKPARWDAPLIWKHDVSKDSNLHEGSRKAGSVANRTLIKAGHRLYGHLGSTIVAIDLPRKKDEAAKLAWSKSLDSVPATMLAADDRLFVVTTDGTFHCFGAASVVPVRHEVESGSSKHDDEWKRVVDQATKNVSNPRGYALVVGVANGSLVQSLLDHTEMKVVVVEEDAQKVGQLRRRVAAHKNRENFQAIVGTPGTIELPPYLATLILSETRDDLQLHSEESLERILRSLRPYGGTLCLRLDEAGQELLSESMNKTDFSNLLKTVEADFVFVRRDGGLPGAADWTHETADAARSFFSRDDLVKAPLGVLWYGDGVDHGFYKRKDYGHGVKPQVAGGRMFALQIATNTLHTVDTYTGQLLWTRKVGGSARYASFPDAVYVADQRTCEVLDVANGESKHTFTIDVGLPDDQPVSVSDIRVAGDIILVAVRFNKENAISKGRWNSEMLAVLDRESGKQLWSRKAEHRYNTAAIAVAGGRVFCIDSHSPADISLLARRGEPTDGLPSTIMALDSRTGKVVWTTIKKDPAAVLTTLHFMSLRTQDDWLAYSAEHNLLLSGKASNTYALNADTGEQVWHKPIRGHQPLILGPTTFINQTGHTYEIATGKTLDGTPLFRRGGCNYAVGNKNLLFLRSNCAAYVDIESRQQYNLRNLRSGCSNSLVAADGLLNVPCFSVGCVCNYPIQTSFSMLHMPAAAAWHGAGVRQAVPEEKLQEK